MPRALPTIALPTSWPGPAKTIVLHALALMRLAFTQTVGDYLSSSVARVRLTAELLEHARHIREQAEQIRILQVRMAAIPPHRRPQYAPEERFAILGLQASAGWNIADTARHFQLDPKTIASWRSRLDEQGEDALVKTRVPVNKYPDWLRLLVRQMKAQVPLFGAVRVAAMLGRAAIAISDSTIKRMRREMPKPAPPPRTTVDETATGSAPDVKASGVRAKYPHHVWNIDLTTIPTLGWWVPWFPFARLPVAPAVSWLAVVLDHYSRAVIAWRLFDKQPTAEEVCALLDESVAGAGKAPKHTITDQGVQFRDAYKAWCRKVGARPRFGAVGQSHSIAVVERFFRSLKGELIRRLPFLLPSKRWLTAEIDVYIAWYHHHRPHRGPGNPRRASGSTTRRIRLRCDASNPGRRTRSLEVNLLRRGSRTSSRSTSRRFEVGSICRWSRSAERRDKERSDARCCGVARKGTGTPAARARRALHTADGMKSTEGALPRAFRAASMSR